MTCKCTCGGCDCPQIKINYLPDCGAAPPVYNPVNFGMANAGANLQQVTIRYDTAGCVPACPPVQGWHIRP